MRFLLHLWICTLLTLPGLAGLGSEGEEIAPGLRLLSSDFGTWERGDDFASFKPGSSLELKQGGQFGWRFRVRTEKDELKLRVVLTLPAPPKQWTWNNEAVDKESKDGLMKISPDRRTASVEKTCPVVDGWVTSSWGFDDGDPYGAHTIHIYLGQKLIRVFRFNIAAPKK